ncbi:MFS transporter [Rubritepida flocculans]|jgi:predicted MFS family arabinose efflux permease|uniref:MFS transporter n=1 Tax=Rubritepida flocculans TaxID=182403 RepID=UPI000428FA1C|nr:MFS transporter [Rubritepida flocculans]
MSRAPHSRLVLTFALAGFASAIATRVADPLVAVLALDFAQEPARVALLATAFALPFALVQPVLGPVADALGKRRVIVFALAFQALFLAASALAPTLLVLLLLRMATGAAGGGIFPVTLALFGDRVPLAERQVAISRFLACAIAGQMAGGVMAGLLEPAIGWRGLMLLCGALSALAVLPLLRDRVPDLRGRLSFGDAVARYRFLLTHRPALALYWAVGIEGMLVFGGFPYVANHLLETGMGGTREAGFTLAAFGCGGFLYAGCAPLLVARLGPRRMMRLGGALAGGGLAGLALAPSAPIFVAAGLFVGTGFFMLHNSLQTRVTEVAPQARASAVSLHAFHFFLGQAMGPPLMGAIRWGFGLEAGLLLAACGLLLLGLVMGRRQETG